MSDFNLAMQTLDLAEGNLSNNKNDKGGLTWKGVSLKFLQLLGKAGDINNDGVINEDDILALSKNDARRVALIKAHFWDFYRIGEINDQALASRALLLFVNLRPLNAAKIIQRAINTISFKKLLVDGQMGSLTIQMLNSLSPELLLMAIKLESVKMYLAIVDNDFSQNKNFRGWVRRAVM